MPGGSFVTTGHTSGSAGAATTACAVADCAPRLPALMVVNAPPRNVRRFIMSGLPSRQGRQKFNNMAGASASRPFRVMASDAIERVARPARRAWRSQRGALHDGEDECRNDQLLHLCSLRSEPYCAG